MKKNKILLRVKISIAIEDLRVIRCYPASPSMDEHLEYRFGVYAPTVGFLTGA